jgi:hypothetical protein
MHLEPMADADLKLMHPARPRRQPGADRRHRARAGTTVTDVATTTGFGIALETAVAWA